MENELSLVEKDNLFDAILKSSEPIKRTSIGCLVLSDGAEVNYISPPKRLPRKLKKKLDINSPILIVKGEVK